MNIRLEPRSENNENYFTSILHSFYKTNFDTDFGKFISDIIITESANYIDVIKSIDPNTGASNNSHAIGVAKTIYNSQTKLSTIILKNHIIVPIIHGINSSQSISSWTIEQLDALYTTLHEFGHAEDHIIRTPHKLIYPTKNFRITNQIEYYSKVISDEIAANINASKYVPHKYKQSGRLLIKEHIESSYSDLLLRIEKLKRNEIDDYSYSDIIGIISIILLKVQEAFISRPKFEESIYDIFGENVSMLYQKQLIDLESMYPSWPKKPETIFSDLYFIILKSFNIRHINGNQSDTLMYCA